MAAISTTRTAIRDALADVIRCYDYTPEQPSFPCAIVGFPSRYDVTDTMSDTATIVLPVSVYVPYAANRAAEDNLERLLTSSRSDTADTGTSIVQAIEDLGARYGVTNIRDFGVLDNAAGNPVALGCVVEVIIYT